MDNVPMIKVYEDGNEWCALAGDNLQEGVCGFGAEPVEAMRAFIAALDSQGRTLEEICARAKHPAPPAIPEEVLYVLREYVYQWSHSTCKCSAANCERRQNLERAKRIDAWLASAPVASDKAVCPECRREHVPPVYNRSVCCAECGHVFDIQVLVISHPRTEKGDK